MFSRVFCFHLFLFNAMIESPTSENVVVVAIKNLFYDDFQMRCFFSQLLCSHCIELVLPTYDDDDVKAMTIVFLVMKLRWWV